MTVKKEVKDIRKELTSINKGISIAFNKVKDELNEHLETINTNTSELSSLTQMLYDLEQKFDKLNERIDELSVSKPKTTQVNITPNLTLHEQEVFITLYTSEKFLSIKDIAKSIAHTKKNTDLIINKLINKEIPIIKQIKNKVVTYALDKNFKRLQATQNVISLS